MKNFKDLSVWRKAVNFYAKLSPVFSRFPPSEKNCIVPQLQRACLSISNNLAEGCGRGSTKNLKYFFYISLGSAKEVENMLYISKELDYLSQNELEEFISLVQEIEKMIFCFLKNIRE